MAERNEGKEAGDAKPNAESRLSLAYGEMVEGKYPSLKCLFVMLVIEFAAFAMLIPIFPFFLIHEIHLGPARVGQLLSAFSLAQLIGAWGSGRVSDATGRRYVIIAVFAVAGVGFGATSVVTTFTEVLLVRVFQGFSGGTAALCDAYVLDIVPAHARASYIGMLGAVKGVAFMFGPGIGVLLIVAGLSRRMIFLVAGGLALAAAAIGLAFLTESLPKEKRRPLCGKDDEKDAGAEAADREGVSAGLLCIWFCRFMSALGLGFLFATYAFLIKDNFGWSDMQFGIMLLFSGLGSATCQFLLFPRVVAVIGAGWSLVSGALIGMVAFGLFPEKSVIVHICAMALFTLSGALIEPAFPVLIGLFASERHLGFANGIAASCRALATMLSPLIAGALYKESARLAYYTAAACFAVAAGVAVAISILARSISSETDRLMSDKIDKDLAA